MKSALRYCDGHLHRINGEALKAHKQDADAQHEFTEAVSAFREAAELRKEAAGLRREADELQGKTDGLLAQLRELEACDFAPSLPPGVYGSGMMPPVPLPRQSPDPPRRRSRVDKAAAPVWLGPGSRLSLPYLAHICGGRHQMF